jgi:glycosyltransferase involved in cell wall biosynthesis
VIPTYNRGEKLAATLEPVLRNRTEGLEAVEVIVVDDGSPVPAAPVVGAFAPPPPFSLRCIRQKNAGPAAARNTGFRASAGDLVIFIDDDIISPPDLISRHVEAHRARPRSVICGRCPFVEPDTVTPLFRFVNSLYDAGGRAAEDFTEIRVVASGQISVEREMFDPGRGVYRDDLATPAAEELELSFRLQELGVPVYAANNIVALHDHPVALESMCTQQYKHAVGYGEVFVKCPDTFKLREVGDVVRGNRPAGRGDSAGAVVRKSLKAALSTRPARSAALRLAKLMERVAPRESLLAPVYHTLIGLHFFAGVREGLRRYSENAKPGRAGAAPGAEQSDAADNS